jgi:hypothetical protein
MQNTVVLLAGYGPPAPHHQQPPPPGAQGGRQPQGDLQQQPDDGLLPGDEPQHVSQDAAGDTLDIARAASQSTAQASLDVTAQPQSEQEGQQ